MEGFSMPTKVIVGNNCVKENVFEITKLGNKALIVTGKNSGRLSGALSDVIELLKKNKVGYELFDRVINNPDLANISEGGVVARQCGADFIIGIGGGSPLDASKAVAVLATNDIEPSTLFKNSWDNTPLPIVAIPTTAGTGSEVTQYSVITRHDMETKMSFGNTSTFPKIAFLDARYTENLTYEVTVSTALDAFTHALEGYTSTKATTASDLIAVESIKYFSKNIKNLLNNTLDNQSREELLIMSMLGGLVIAHTGTTLIHRLGYHLTYFKDIHHGKANAFFICEYIRAHLGVCGDKVTKVLSILDIGEIEELDCIIRDLVDLDNDLTKDEILRYVSKTCCRPIKNSLIHIDVTTVCDIVNRSLTKRS